MSQLIHTPTPPKTVFYAQCNDSPAGKITVGLTEEVELCRVSFEGERQALAEWQKEWPRTDFIKTKKALRYKDIQKCKILLVGTDFQHKVWRVIAQIPAGKTLSYGAIAKRLKNPKASRAVGGACGKNPVPLLIPCHRVIAENGGIGGFSSALTIKVKLLKQEKMDCLEV